MTHGRERRQAYDRAFLDETGDQGHSDVTGPEDLRDPVHPRRSKRSHVRMWLQSACPLLAGCTSVNVVGSSVQD